MQSVLDRKFSKPEANEDVGICNSQQTIIGIAPKKFFDTMSIKNILSKTSALCENKCI